MTDRLWRWVGHPVAFLQNAWVRDPERLRETLARHDEVFRLDMLRRLLFSGCVTGRRLQAAFGPLCEQIVWEESTREIAGDPRTILPADQSHIIDVLLTFQPTAVIAFGGHAGAALRRLFDDDGWLPVHCGVKLLFAPHPAARHRTTHDLLRMAADNVRVYVLNTGSTGSLSRVTGDGYVSSSGAEEDIGQDVKS